MAANQYLNQVQNVYIAYYGRPADPEGLAYWANRLDQANGNLNEIISAFGNSAEATSLYGNMSYVEQVQNIYQQLFGRQPDQAGLDFYVGKLTDGSMSRTSVMLDILNGAQNEDREVLENKQAVAHAFTAHLNESHEVNAYAGDEAANAVRDFMKGVDAQNLNSKQLQIDPVIVQLVGEGAVSEPGVMTLTAGTDSLSGKLFNAPVGYTPGGNDRVNTLQDEDKLVGLGGNATLNVTLGTPNDNGASVVTPELHNIKTINVDFTSSVADMELNLQDAPGVEYINVNRVSADNAYVADMRSIPLNMTLNNTTGQVETVVFDFAAHTLDRVSKTDPFSDGDVLGITVNNADVDTLIIGEVHKQQNFLEKLRIDSAGNQVPNTIGALNVQGLEQLVVSGSSNLTIGDLVGMDTTLRSLDLRDMTGKLTLSDAAVDLIKVDEDSLNAGQMIDGQDSASDVLEIFDTANVSPADLAGFKNIDKIVFSSGNQSEEQVLTLKLNDAVLDAFDTAGTASLATPEIVKIALGAGTATKKVVLDLTDVTTPGKFLFEVSAADLVNFQLIDPNGVFPGVPVVISNPVFSIADVTVVEGGDAVVTITRDDATEAADITVQTADGTATSPADYVGVGTTISFAAGELTKQVSITTIDDAEVEAAETFTVAISAPTRGTVSATAGTATVNITDNDVAGNLITIPVPSEGSVAGTAGVDIFVFDAVDARAEANNTQVSVTDFAAAFDSLRIDLADATGITTLAALNGQQGVVVETDPFAGSLLVTFGPDANGDVIALTLAGITDAATVNIDVI